MTERCIPDHLAARAKALAEVDRAVTAHKNLWDGARASTRRLNRAVYRAHQVGVPVRVLAKRLGVGNRRTVYARILSGGADPAGGEGGGG